MTTPSKEAVEAAIVAFQHENAMSRANAELYCPRWVALALDAFAARGEDDMEPVAWVLKNKNGGLEPNSFDRDESRLREFCETVNRNGSTIWDEFPYTVVPLYAAPPPPDAAAKFQERIAALTRERDELREAVREAREALVAAGEMLGVESATVAKLDAPLRGGG